MKKVCYGAAAPAGAFAGCCGGGPKLLMALWHTLSKQVADKNADPQKVADSAFNHVYRGIEVDNLPGKPLCTSVCAPAVGPPGIWA